MKRLMSTALVTSVVLTLIAASGPARAADVEPVDPEALWWSTVFCARVTVNGTSYVNRRYPVLWESSQKHLGEHNGTS